MASVGKLPFDHCRDGISLTTTILPNALGDNRATQVATLVRIMDKMFAGVQSGDSSTMLYHSNINVLTEEMMQEAYENPDDPKFNNLCVRISGYCVLWSRLTTEQRLDILNRTFHKSA
jgi:formate C-acetyltransferase